MIEKKLIICSILVAAIGIASVVPLEYFMIVNAQTIQNPTMPSQPWFNVNVPYVYVNLDESGANDTASWNGVNIEGIANFTLTHAGIDLQGADAKIEYYQFEVSSDQGPIVNVSYSVALSVEKFPAGNDINNIPGIPGGGYMAINGGGQNQFFFANGLTYNGIPNYNGYCSGSNTFYEIIGDNLPSTVTNQTYSTGVFGSYIMNYNGDNSNQVIAELRSARTLYIDVSRICSVSYAGNVTVSTPSSNQVLQHLEFTKAGNGFVYGIYTSGEVPFPMETPPTEVSSTTTATPTESPIITTWQPSNDTTSNP